MLHVLASPSRDSILATISQHASDSSNPGASSFNLETLLTDPLLHALFSETLRLQATTLTVRGVMSDSTLPVIDDEYFIRKGTILIAPASALHMDSEIFPNPRTFKSDRFYGHGDIESVHIPATGLGEYSSNITRDTKEDKSGVKDKQVLDIPGALIGRKDNRFKKNGIVVKHNLIPFGGGDHLVLSIWEVANGSVLGGGLQSMRL
jgi:cytochrome P450